MNRAACNLTQAWWDVDKENLLRVNGFSMQGSDFEIFAKLCLCIDGLSDVGKATYQASFDALCPSLLVPLTFANAGKIWTETSNLFWQEGTTFSRRKTPNERVATPISRLSLEENPSIGSIECLSAKADARSWNAWREEASIELEALLKRGSTVSICLPADFSWQKPNLYAVERHLTGEAESENLWLSQQLYFLFSMAKERNFRPLLQADCGCEQVIDALQGIASFGVSVPIFYRSANPLTSEELVSLCRAIGQRKEGERPLYLVRHAGEACEFCGAFGDISVIIPAP